MLRPLTKRWRSRGFKSVIFIDDGIAGQKTEALTSQMAENVETDLIKAGFTINREKSDFTPKQTGKWLGFIIDTRTMTFSVPVEKLKKLKNDIRYTLTRKFVTPKDLAKLAGTLSSMHQAIGPLVRLFTRNMYQQISISPTWYQPITLTPHTTSDLNFWLQAIDRVNGCTFKPRPTTTQMVFTDASGNG